MFAAAQTFFGRLWVRVAAVALSLVWQFFMVTYRLAESNHFADEPIYSESGWSYLHGRFDQNLEHPPTAKYLLGLGQEWWGQGITSGRIMAAIFVLVAALVLGLMIASEAGIWGGLLAANFFVVMPQGAQNFAASAMLEPFMVSFLVFALAAAWVWHRTGIWAMLWLAGAFFAFSVTSKVAAAVAVVAFIVVLFNKHHWLKKVLGAAGFVGAFWLITIWVYSQIGFDRGLNFMLAFQGHHNDAGHPVIINGADTSHPQWWATLWFMFALAGIPLSLCLIALAAVALTWRPSQLTIMLFVALAALVVFYSAISKISLSHYYLGFFWLFGALAALGFARLTRWASESAPLSYKPRFGPAGTRKMARATLAAVLVLIGLVLGNATVLVRQTHPYGLALVTKTMKHAHVWGRVFIVGAHNNLNDYLPGHYASDSKHAPYAAIFVGTDARAKYAMPKKMADYIAQHQSTLKRYDLGEGTYLLISSVPIPY